MPINDYSIGGTGGYVMPADSAAEYQRQRVVPSVAPNTAIQGTPLVLEKGEKMTTTKLFTITVLQHPTKEALDKGAEPEIIFGPETINAADARAACVAVGVRLGGVRLGGEPNFAPTRLEVKIQEF